MVSWTSAALIALGCSRQSDLDEVFEPPRRVEPSAAVTFSVSDFDVAAGSPVLFTIGARERAVRGRIELVSGRLRIDPSNLAATSGTLTFDLSTTELENDPASPARPASLGELTQQRPTATPSATSTEQSLRWLELADPERVAAHPELRYARFSILSVGSLSAGAAYDGEAVPSSAPDATRRRVRLRVSGELELHRVRLPYTLSIVATFEWPGPAERGTPPGRIEIASAEPASVDFIAHGVVPRDARGDVMAEKLAELRKSPTKEAQLTAHWVATLKPPSPPVKHSGR